MKFDIWIHTETAWWISSIFKFRRYKLLSFKWKCFFSRWNLGISSWIYLSWKISKKDKKKIQNETYDLVNFVNLGERSVWLSNERDTMFWKMFNLELWNDYGQFQILSLFLLKTCIFSLKLAVSFSFAITTYPFDFWSF